jgi:CspA family cold shock protein
MRRNSVADGGGLAKDECMLPSEPSDEDLHNGTVKFFNEEKGWGAIASDTLPSGHDAWVHFSNIDSTGYRSLREGQAVRFAFEQVKQDSFDYRATYVRLV